MASETKTGKTTIEFIVSPSMKKKLQKHCKKEGVSVSQHLRDLVQKDLKG